MDKKKLMFLAFATVFALGVGTITISGLHQVDEAINAFVNAHQPN